MNRDQIRQLYDESYASTYNERFLTAGLAKSEAEFEEELLRKLLRPGMRWLDAACGTGYFLSLFPEVQRAGLDLSPAMIERARQVNPNVTFHLRSFLEPSPEFENQWDFVSCMWYAYGLVDTLDQVEQVIRNLASWTSPDGTCFVPLADPGVILGGMNLPYKLPSPWAGDVLVSGIIWSYVEDAGTKVHSHMIAPQVPWMRQLFDELFESVEQIVYPPPFPGWQALRSVLIGRRKRQRPAAPPQRMSPS